MHIASTYDVANRGVIYAINHAAHLELSYVDPILIEQIVCTNKQMVSFIPGGLHSLIIP